MMLGTMKHALLEALLQAASRESRAEMARELHGSCRTGCATVLPALSLLTGPTGKATLCKLPHFASNCC